MPQLWSRNISESTIQRVVQDLFKDLAHICDCSVDLFQFEVIQATSFTFGSECNTFPFIEVRWFDRGHRIQDQVATAIQHHFHAQGINELEIAFITYEKRNYYIEGKPFEI